MSEWIGAALFLAAVAGHAVLVIRSHNHCYGSGLGRRAVDTLQMVHVVLMLAGPVALWLAFGFDLSPLLRAADYSPAALYAYLCWLVLAFFVPLTVWRLIRPKPAALES